MKVKMLNINLLSHVISNICHNVNNWRPLAIVYNLIRSLPLLNEAASTFGDWLAVSRYNKMTMTNLEKKPTRGDLGALIAATLEELDKTAQAAERLQAYTKQYLAALASEPAPTDGKQAEAASNPHTLFL